jgi:iron complex outermembrane recepter protein
LAGANGIDDRGRPRRRLIFLAHRLASTVSLIALGAPGVALAQETPSVNIPEVRVIATTPAPASSPRRAPSRPAPTGPARRNAPPPADTPPPILADPTVIDRDKVPSNTESLTAEEFSRTYSTSVTDTLQQRVPGVATSDIQGNSFTQDLRYRGFTASPLQGTPQGIAVYMGGIRVNEAFGDTVNWDLIPTNAIDRADVWSSNPVFGLNALGGAVNIGMKNGFTYQGFEGELQGGSFGRASGAAQYGVQKGAFALYLAAQGLYDQGWRFQSPSNVRRIYADLGWKDERSELHLVAAAARNSFGVIGPTPVQLLDRDYRAIYTWPQITNNEAGLLALNGKFAVAPTWTVQSNIYVRGFRQRHIDGNDADVERCSGNAMNPLFNTLCLDDDGFPPPVPAKANFQILGPNNQPIPCPPGPGNQCAVTPYGTIDRTNTSATTIGGSLQATSNTKLFDHGNQFTVGTSLDHSKIDFSANSTLGFIYPNLLVAPNPAIPGNGLVIHTLGDLGYSPVGLDAANTYFGFFATDTFDITERLAATIGARLNVAKILMADTLGTSPELNGNYTFQRLNPQAGLAYKIIPGLTAFGGYSESNRAPTPLELGCANPQRPCLIENFIVSDPPLQQVVAKSYEAGVRGVRALNDGRLEWKLVGFRTDSENDILNVASQIQGRGVFQNVAATRRQGLEAGANFQSAQWLVYANYSFIDATFQFTGDIASPNNPSADADGNVHVTPGKHIPGIPQHQLKVGFDYAATPLWKFGADVIAVGSQFYVGDPANQNEKLPAYWVANLHTSYQLRKDVQIFGVVNNLFNQKFGVSGTYFEPQSVANSGIGVTLTDQRMQTPVAPLAIYVGLRAKL